MKVMLRLRDLSTGELKNGEHDDVESAIAWLKERPRFVDVLGVVFEGLTPEDNERMRTAMRPLDDEEQAAEQKLDAADAEKRHEEDERRAEEMAKMQAAQREEAKTADPGRPLALRYHYKHGIQVTEPYDDRVPNDDVKEAVAAWIAERNEWVESRGQMIAEAKIVVWPEAVPAGKDRIIEGTFVPCTK